MNGTGPSGDAASDIAAVPAPRIAFRTPSARPPEEASARTTGAGGIRSLGARRAWLSVGQARDSCSWAFDAPTPVSPWAAPRWILAAAFVPAFAVSGLRSWA